MITLVWKTFEDLKVGDRAVLTRTVTEADVLAFAGLVGDFYPVHVDETYARETRFAGRVAHGLHVGAFVSAVNGAILGLGGGISLSQTFTFKAPVRLGETLTVEGEIVEKRDKGSLIRVKHTIRNERGEVVVEGEALEKKDPHPFKQNSPSPPGGE